MGLVPLVAQPPGSSRLLAPRHQCIECHVGRSNCEEKRGKFKLGLHGTHEKGNSLKSLFMVSCSESLSTPACVLYCTMLQCVLTSREVSYKSTHPPLPQNRDI